MLFLTKYYVIYKQKNVQIVKRSENISINNKKNTTSIIISIEISNGFEKAKYCVQTYQYLKWFSNSNVNFYKFQLNFEKDKPCSNVAGF